MKERLVASQSGVGITCGQEKGVFDLRLYGPGGGSRCIQFGEHLITPIEFEALAGRKGRNWKSNIKVDGQSLRNYFGKKLLKSCEKDCNCPNCETGRQYPTDLELLIEKVYINNTVDLSIVKKEKEEENVTEKMIDKPGEDSTIVSDVKDEFFSSPETTPKKKKKRSSVETPMDEILPVDDSPATSEQSSQRKRELTSPIHVITTHNFDMTGKPIKQIVDIPEDKMIRDELVPVKQDVTGDSAGTVTSPPGSPAGRSDSSVEVVEDVKPRIEVLEVDLTDGREQRSRRGPGRPSRASNEEEKMLEILQQEKKKVVTPRKKLPRDAKNTLSKEVAKPAVENPAKRKRTEQVEIIKKSSSTGDTEVAPVRKSARNEASNEIKKRETESQSQTLKQKKVDTKSAVTPSPVKIEKVEAEKVSPSKLPTYTTMIRSALEEMNCDGGEGCTKLEILLYILRKFRPKGNVEQITSKLIKVLEVGTKRGDFLSSVSCPRVIKKDSQEKTREKSVASEKGEKEKKKKIVVTKVKSKSTIAVKRGRPASVNSNKDKKEKKKEKVKVKDQGKTGKTKEKKVINYTPKKLLEPLSTICKVKKGTRYEVLRKVWTYIRLKKLQDPSDRTTIICDENLKKLTKCKKFNQNALMGYLKPFMKPV